ncbi:MAG: CoA transferase [Chloroflexi bacterium]|nr:CoA transferase [Chloroflexota bacterium]
MPESPNGMDLLLSPYRVLDLTDERGLLCGKILADLCADVVQIEPPGGSTARRIGPYYQDQIHPEKSLYWWAYAANKRGITLDLETGDGRELLKRLVKDAHFLIESFPPGYLGSLSLGYQDLKAINPGLVMVSITPFGKDGPYAHWKAGDLMGMALGGFMYLTGDSDRPPVRVSFPHFYLHGGAAGATGAMMAHTHRALTGAGQHVDVSCQQAVAKTLAHAPQSWDLEGTVIKRMGVFRQTSGTSVVRTCWPCKDGYINYVPQGGSAGVAASTRALLAWMDEEGMGDEYLNSVNWEELGYGQVPAEVMAKVVPPLERFFATHTRQELVQASMERRILLFPVATQGDILEHPHLKARDYFQELDHPELDATVTYPGLFVKDREGTRLGLRRRPPLIGEHNHEIYQDELGLSREELGALKESGAI